MSTNTNRRYGSDPATVHEGDILYMTGTGREVRVLECHPPHVLLVRPTDGKVFYVRNDGAKIMQAWWGYERVCKDREDALKQ